MELIQECPAEYYIERISPSHSNCTSYRYVWEICQPDACWGVYESGVEDSYEAALEKALQRLKVVRMRQGF